MKPSLARRTVAEFIGTAFLVAAVIGSGIMAERLSNGNLALALLANTIATGAALVALILTFGPVSGAHLNPVVTIMDAFQHGLPWSETPHYVIAQILGGITGAFSAHIMFGLSLISLSHHVRSGPTQIFGEFVATFGLLAVIWGCSRLRTRGLASSGDGAPILSLTITDSSSVAYAVGAYITAAYWFTSSTSFANPAVTIAPFSQRHIRRHPPRRRPRIRLRPIFRCPRCNAPLSLVLCRAPCNHACSIRRTYHVDVRGFSSANVCGTGIHTFLLHMLIFSIALDRPIPGEQAHLEVSPLEARLLPRKPRVVFQRVVVRIQRQEGSTSSAAFFTFVQGQASCPTYRIARPLPAAVQGTLLQPDPLTPGKI